jgi:UrcA family protein
MNRIRHLIPIVLLSSIAAAPAFAEDGQRVAFADLDLSTPAGVATLDRRIEGAVRRICGHYFPNSPASRAEVERCRSETLASVYSQRSDAIASAQTRAVQLSAR